MGQVLPSAEDCTTPADESCDGLTPPCGGTHAWSRGFGDAAEQSGIDVAVSEGGEIVVIGTTAGAADFGGGATPPQGGTDVFVARFDAAGGRQWDRLFGDSGFQDGRGVAIGSDGSAIITGYFSGSINFGGTTQSSGGGVDVFVAKLDPDGAHLWSRSYGGVSNQYANAVAVDASDNVALVGHFAGTLSLGGSCPSMTSAGGNDVFIAKLDPMGACLWNRRAGSSAAQQYGYGVTVDGAGSVIAIGSFAGSADFGTGTKTSAGQTDIFVAKYDSAGTSLWSNTYGDTADQYGYAVASDATGNVFIVGYFSSTLTFGGEVLSSSGGYDIFVGKLDSAGNPLWGKRFGGPGDQFSNGVAIDGDNNLVITGSFAGATNFGGASLSSTGDSDLFIAKLNGATGGHIWSYGFGGASGEVGYAVAIDNLEHTIVTGSYGSNLLGVGGTPLMNRGATDILLARYLP
ncbi:hypothetical protein [Sorangium sp. So ce542]|uniref:hypothetical protein n=1 Tax=Sorangium sp. So ce542 TaxID=3133316 RepID=UPI003F5DB184